MTVMRSVKGKFSVERLYAPRSVVVLGPQTPEGRRVLANLLEGGFLGTLMVIGDAGPSNAAHSFRSIEELPEAPDLAVLACTAAEAGPYLMALGRRGHEGRCGDIEHS